MRRAEDRDRQKILDYLKKKVYECLYLYIDMKIYGLDNPNIHVWIDEDENGIRLVVMKYYDSFQIYSHKPLDRDLSETLVRLFADTPVSMISARRDIIEAINGELPDYEVSYGSIYRIEDSVDLSSIDTSEVIRATADDAADIAKLVCSNKDLGGYYSVEGLAKQFADRIRDGIGRNYFIKRDNTVTAHIATYAETDDLAVISGAIVRPEYRNTDDFYKIRTCLLRDLKSENKQAFGFANVKRLIRYHDRIHEKCGEYGKMVKLKAKG